MDWLTPTVSGVVGLGGLVTGLWASISTRKSEERRERRQNEFATRTVDAVWYREKRADADLQLLELVEVTWQWVHSVFPIWDTNPPREVRELPTLDRQAEVWARVSAYASPEVAAAAERWRETVNEAIRAAEAVARDEDDARRDLDAARARVDTARTALVDLISQELKAGAAGIGPSKRHAIVG
jgi:hypothetical protein